jgi:hypothetical protein
VAHHAGDQLTHGEVGAGDRAGNDLEGLACRKALGGAMHAPAEHHADGRKARDQNSGFGETIHRQSLPQICVSNWTPNLKRF